MPIPEDIEKAALLSVSKAAQMLGLSKGTIRNMCDDGRLRWLCMDDGNDGVYCIRRQAVEDMMREKGIPVP